MCCRGLTDCAVEEWNGLLQSIAARPSRTGVNQTELPATCNQQSYGSSFPGELGDHRLKRNVNVTDSESSFRSLEKNNGRELWRRLPGTEQG